MAVKDEKSSKDESTTGAGTSSREGPAVKAASNEGAPSWVVPLYLVGLVLIYLGERVFGTLEGGRLAASGLGLSCVLAATATRFVPTWQSGGERGRIERLLGLLSLVGLVSLVFYLGSTEWGLAKLGLAEADVEVRERVSDLLTVAWVSLIVMSVLPMLFAEAALYPMRGAERLESRRVINAAMSGLVIALAASYGTFFVYAASSAEAQADFSYFKTSEPSDSTRKLIEGLGEPIRVTAFFPEVSPVRKEVEGYLRKLAEGVPTLEYAVYDRYLEPQVARDLKIVRDGEIVVQKGEAKRTLNVGTELKDAQAKLKTLDREFQLRVYKLLRAQRTIYMTVGHGEVNDDDRGVQGSEGRSAQVLKQLLGKQHYVVKSLGLSQGLGNDVPDDADVVMVLGPTEPFAPEELGSLRRYAERGGKLFLALDPEALVLREVEVGTAPGSRAEAQEPGSAEPSPGAAESDADQPTTAAGEGAPGAPQGTLAGLQALASLAGLELDPTMLANDQQHVRRRYNDSDRTLLITNRFSSHASVSTLSRNSARAAVLLPGSGSLEKAKGSTAKADVALRAMSSTFADTNRNYRFDSADEKRAAYGLAYAVTVPVEVEKPPGTRDKAGADTGAGTPSDPVPTPSEMRAFVVADADFLTDMVLTNFMTNQLFIVDAVRWLGGEESYAGEVNDEEDVRIEHTQQKDLVWFYSTIFGVPALVLGVGLVIGRRSRRPLGGKK
jgi:hypothetical protein